MRFRKKLTTRHEKTDYYHGSMTTGDALFSGQKQPLPALVYRDMRFDWKGQEYRIYRLDNRRIYEPDNFTKYSYSVWIDPWDLSSAWFWGEEVKVRPVLPEEEDDDEEPDEGPLVAIDVHYDGDESAMAAAVMFDHWQSKEPSGTLTKRVSPIAPYEPGAFYKRELPCILALLEQLDEAPYVLIIDGYVTLGADARDGLGMHLFRALDESIPVIGVAKTKFEGTPKNAELLRGESKQPLYITAAGVSQDSAKAFIRWMDGPHRMPKLLTMADRLARDSAQE